MAFLLTGAVFGFLSGLYMLMANPGWARHPVQGLAFATAAGAVVLGLPLWVISLILA